MMKNADLESQLNSLLTRHYDSEKGYEQIAGKVRHAELKDFLKRNAQERNRFGHELKDIIRQYGGSPEKASSTKADMHRAWINIKDKLTGSADDESILEEAERGEDYAITDYQQAVENDAIKPEHRRILSDHLHSIRNSREQINKLKTIV